MHVNTYLFENMLKKKKTCWKSKQEEGASGSRWATKLTTFSTTRIEIPYQQEIKIISYNETPQNNE